MPEKVQELLGGGSKFGVRFTYIDLGEPKGIAHAILCAKEFMGRTRSSCIWATTC